MPGQTLAEIAIPFRGRTLYVAGERTFDTWTTAVFNDTDFGVRREIERWMNGINDLVNNTGATNPADYRVDMIVQQLDRDDTILKSYVFRNAFPLTIGTIDLSSAEAGEIETFEVTWRYQHYEPSGVSF